jgi:SsrA-binding protein
MTGMGCALMGSGFGKGEKRAIDAALMAITSPLLEDVSINGATGILVNITGGPAGLALVGSEVKSIRDGKVALVDAYAVIEKNEAWLCELEIGVYAFAHARNHDPRRRRKLLLHRTDIDRLADKVRGKGLTLVPLSLYEKDGRVKVELALVHGK